MKRNILIFLIFFNPFIIKGQNHELLDFLSSIPNFSINLNLKNLKSKDSVTVSFYNSIVFKHLPDYPYYLFNGQKENDLSNLTEISSFFDANDSFKKKFYNKVFILGKLKIQEKFQLVIIKIVYIDFIIISLCNYNKDGYLISAIPFHKYSKSGPYGDINFEVTKSTFNPDGTIDQLTEADFMLKRKIKLREDGIFEVIEQKVEDY